MFWAVCNKALAWPRTEGHSLQLESWMTLKTVNMDVLQMFYYLLSVKKQTAIKRQLYDKTGKNLSCKSQINWGNVMKCDVLES